MSSAVLAGATESLSARYFGGASEVTKLIVTNVVRSAAAAAVTVDGPMCCVSLVIFTAPPGKVLHSSHSIYVTATGVSVVSSFKSGTVDLSVTVVALSFVSTSVVAVPRCTTEAFSTNSLCLSVLLGFGDVA